uniref:Uncharacterized protein n=1 Tax=Angiostrongylus cantonensis TaxID=6313 RepID=A0A0K0DR06_ANGCA
MIDERYEMKCRRERHPAAADRSKGEPMGHEGRSLRSTTPHGGRRLSGRRVAGGNLPLSALSERPPSVPLVSSGFIRLEEADTKTRLLEATASSLVR